MHPRISNRLPSVLLGLSLPLLAQDAHAAPPRQRGELDGGAYVHISPGPLAVVIDEHKFSREARWVWPWSLGAGWMFARGTMFKATLGMALEHRVFVLEQVTPHGLHALAESRIGAGSRRVWGYGLVGVGAAAVLVKWGEHATDDFYGVLVQYGAGVQGLVGRRFFVGGELDFDVGYYYSEYRHIQVWDSFYYQSLTIELMSGWYF